MTKQKKLEKSKIAKCPTLGQRKLKFRKKGQMSEREWKNHSKCPTLDKGN